MYWPGDLAVLCFGASQLALAAAGQWMVSLAMQLPRFSLLQSVRTKLIVFCFSQIVPAPKLGNYPPKWLVFKGVYGLKWSLTPLSVPPALVLKQRLKLLAGAGSSGWGAVSQGPRGPRAARWDPLPGCSQQWEYPDE